MPTTSVIIQKEQIYLLGVRNLKSLNDLDELPTLRLVLLRMHEFLLLKENIQNSASLVINEVLLLWERTSIPTMLKRNCIPKLIKIHVKWYLIKKNKKRLSKTQADRENLFVKELDKLFDISSADALSSITSIESKNFLIDQRGERKMSISLFIVKVKKSCQFKVERLVQDESIAELCFSDSGSDDPNYKPRLQNNANKSNCFTKQVVSSLDRNKVTDRGAVKIMIPLMAALGHDPNTLTISRSTIQRVRKRTRREFSENIKNEFVCDYPLVVHWDGKILIDTNAKKRVDRLRVVISGDGSEKLLGVPKLTEGTGEQICNSVYNLLEKWNVKQQVKAMSFDTTSVNTGCKKGACCLLEEKIGHDLLWLACRHHLMEIILSKVFKVCFGPSTGPDIPLFKRFTSVWENIVLENYASLEEISCPQDLIRNTLEVIMKAVEKKQIRDDYQELIELAMILLKKPPFKIHWRSPGPIHHARWMAKLLYAFKIYLFRGQSDVFTMTKTEEVAICRFVKFGLLIYTKAWVEAPLAAEAPGGDLMLWKNLKIYEIIDLDIANEARIVLERHLWYLSDELVGLALFSEKVSCDDKRGIVQGLLKKKKSRMVRGNSKFLAPESVLGDFATVRTMQTLSLLNISEKFLQFPPEQWGQNVDYLNGKKAVNCLRVVNDTAERGVKFYQEYNNLLTKDENDKQSLLQLVELDRKEICSDVTKKYLVNKVLKEDEIQKKKGKK